MKESSSLTLIGILMGIVILILVVMRNVGLRMFLDLPFLVITIGGSFCALMITHSLGEIKNLGKIFLQSLKIGIIDRNELIIQFLEISKKAKIGGLLSVENEIYAIDDPFMKKGLQMVVDGVESEVIKEILELEIDEMDKRHINGVNIFKTWGKYAPAFGMIGTLIGIIEMLSNLTSPENIALGMSRALIATFYGVILANLIFNPIAENLMKKNIREIDVREMMVEGILAIKSGINPRILEEKLISYLSPTARLEYLAGQVNLNEGVNGNG